MLNIFENLINVEVGGVNVGFNISKNDNTSPTVISTTSHKTLVLLIVGFYMTIMHDPESVESKITSLTGDLRRYQFGKPEGHVKLRTFSGMSDGLWTKIRMYFKDKDEKTLDWQTILLEIQKLFNDLNAKESDLNIDDVFELIDQIGDNVLFNRGASGLSDEIAFHFNDLLAAVMQDPLYTKELVAAGAAWVKQLAK